MSMEKAIMNEMNPKNYRTAKITHILKTLGLGDIKEGVMILSYAGIPIYLASQYDWDQIYTTIIEVKLGNGESDADIIRWLAARPIDNALRDRLNRQLAKSA